MRIRFAETARTQFLEGLEYIRKDRPYRFFYRKTGQTIWIVAVWYSAQLPDGPRH